ncbi:MAG: hypothetical protein WAT71_12820 [Ignavibacteria bacterium]
MKKIYINFTLTFIFLIFIIIPTDSYSRKVVCIDSASYTFNSFSANHEGWEWQTSRPGDIIEVAGNLDSCLKKLMNGDTLVIITHGEPGQFTWGGDWYDGIGNDTNAINPYPVHAGFDTLKNIYAKMCMCYSDSAADASGSMVEKIVEALGGAGNGNSADGFKHQAWAANCYLFTGGSIAQRNTAMAVLAKSYERWATKPPANRVPTPNPNQKTEAKRLVDSALGGSNIVTISNIIFKQPKDTTVSSGGGCGGGDVEAVDMTPQGVMLLENFEYPAGDSLGYYGWRNFSGGTTNRFLVNPFNMPFPGYPLNSGNSITIKTNGQDDYKDLYYSVNEGSVYATFVTVIQSATPGGDYFAAFLPGNINTNFQCRVYAKDVGGLVALGISKSTDPAQYGPATINYGQPILVIMKYTFNTGTNTDDLMTLFVSQGPLPPIPLPPYAGPVTGIVQDLPDISKFAIRQGNATNAPVIDMDGIKVSQDWNSTALNLKLALQGFFNPNTNTNIIADTFTVQVRSDLFPYNIVDQSQAVIGQTLSGNFYFSNLFSGNYYLTVRHRNGLETWSSSPVLMQQGGTYSYDFTNNLSKAYGNNLIQVGNKFCVYSGDVNQDGTIDLADGSLVDNDAINFVTGYVPTDINGDGIVDLSDGVFTDNNTFNFISVISP